MYVCLYVCMQIFQKDIAQIRPTLYGLVRLIRMGAMNYGQKSTPFFCVYIENWPLGIVQD